MQTAVGLHTNRSGTPGSRLVSALFTQALVKQLPVVLQLQEGFLGCFSDPVLSMVNGAASMR